MNDAIIKAATRALLEVEAVEDAGLDQDELARRVVAAVTPLIRAAALEEAAQVAEEYGKRWSYGKAIIEVEAIAAAIRANVLEEAAQEAEDCVTGEDAAHNIRALKEQP